MIQLKQATQASQVDTAMREGYTVTGGNAYRMVKPAMGTDRSPMVRMYPSLDECRAFQEAHGFNLADMGPAQRKWKLAEEAWHREQEIELRRIEHSEGCALDGYHEA